MKSTKENILTINGETISGSLTVFKFRDKDTRQIIHFAPTLDLTGYGIDEKNLLKCFNFLLKISLIFFLHFQ